MADIPVRVSLLKKLHLFAGLSDDEVRAAAEMMDETPPYKAGEEIFAQGMSGDAFYIVFKGRVNIFRRKKKKDDERIAWLGPGDYFGEEALLEKTQRTATVRAEEGTILFVLHKSDFNKLIKKIATLRPNFEIAISSRRLARQLRFKWLGPNEVVYLLTRKHTILLYQAMALPVAALLIPAILFLLAVNTPFWNLFALLGTASLVIFLGWGIWRYIDWGNDFYIVTNQRVIWLEKVIGLYDSRQEAMLPTVLSVNASTDQWGRWLNYGDVIVRTFTGEIRLAYVGYPRQVEAMVREYWSRTQSVSRELQQDVMKQAIRNKLGIANPDKPAPPPAPPPPRKQKANNRLAHLFSGRFTLRIEEGETVIYRKHWFILVRDTWKQVAIFALLFILPFAWPALGFGNLPVAVLTLLITFIFVDLLWWIYGYVDWSNDIFQVTADQIIDVYKKPLGREERRAAPLENILSTEYKRRGILGLLLNYGTVFIAVGGTKFDFEDVADPPTVQQDIVRRMTARKAKKSEGDAAADREKMAEWLAMYHRTVEEQRKSQNPE